MPIYRCKQCSFIAEDTSTLVGEKTDCTQCGAPCMVYDTVFYVEKLLERYFSALREIKAPQVSGLQASPPVPTPAYKPPNSMFPTLAEVDRQHTAPIARWFAARQVEVQFEHAEVDTHGFFNDAAYQMGLQFSRFADLIDRVRHAYHNSHTLVHLELGSQPPDDAQAVNALCRWLFEHSFFARYHYQKPEKLIGLTLRPSQAIHQFFDGGWLQRYVFLRLQELLKHRAQNLPFARGAKLVVVHEEPQVLDVLVLPPDQAPICITCKSGEFRRDIDSSLRLRKQLGIDRSRFIICASDLGDEQAAGLTAMYDLTFVNLASLGPHVASLV